MCKALGRMHLLSKTNKMECRVAISPVLTKECTQEKKNCARWPLVPYRLSFTEAF